MRKSTWTKLHNGSGIILGFFLLMFCVSGILLNHRDLIAGIDVSRRCLPPWYAFRDWNGGLLRGTVRLPAADPGSGILVYGSGGIFLTDSAASVITPFMRGLPHDADRRQIRAVVLTRDGRLCALTPYALWLNDSSGVWHDAGIRPQAGERFSDMTCRGDTLVVAGRSYLYISPRSGVPFSRMALAAPDGYKPRMSLFRIVWMLHSGAMFGLPGRLAVDAIAIVIILLCLTGWIIWLGHARVRRSGIRLHNRVGVATILLTFLVVITGWCLRPPLMIPLAIIKVPPVPATALSSPDPWHDRIRMIRYDDRCGDWLISASDGFYSLKTLSSVPVPLSSAPPVSVMGLNVFEQDPAGTWICGSFSGLYRWDRLTGRSTDFFTGLPAPSASAPPFGRTPVSGFSAHFGPEPVVAEFYRGTTCIPQPDTLSSLPLSLWNVALEVHSGRIYFGPSATYFFIFIIGAAAILLLWSGWKLRLPRRRLPR